MIEDSMSKPVVDDPRKLSALLARVADLAQCHNVGSVVVGMAAEQGNRLFPEFVEFLCSALRVEDCIYRMTRERAVLHLADLDLDGGQAVLSRLMDEFVEEFPMSKEPHFEIRMVRVEPGCEKLEHKEILQEIFPSRMLH